MRLRQVDLNLLNVFDAVMRFRSVTQAAESLALSPSAVSHALARLRLALKDDLFIRDDQGMTPTPRALALAGGIQDGLSLLARTLDAEPFLPSDSIRTFRIAAGDYATAFLLPPLMRRLLREAPLIDLRVMPVNRTDVGRLLNTGAVDLVIGWFDHLPPDLSRQLLVRDSGGLVVRAGHPLTEGVPTFARAAAFPHVVVDLTGEADGRGDGFFDDRGMIRRVWMERLVLHSREDASNAARVALSVPHFTSIPFLLRDTDLVATLPRRLADWATADGGLVYLGPLLAPEEVDVEIIWHNRTDQDAGLAWLRRTLIEANQAPA
ncbi:LysR family transcriptional regulator [Acidisoma silvae]|uniref:LysR family transcriptional regulator n=1 Tax=Acidisoma silvae TaxID=2802396 RepID=A0A963YRL3_9PROT|nr:LysR family transcriptional regulator [Acidisoma silvae]MCB8875307.1 LysR family transcriptional regulator [Acidisoma silvae]